jgi:hypothetical protein
MNHQKTHIYRGTKFSISHIIAGMFCALVMLGLVYGYFLQATVRHAVAFDKIQVSLEHVSTSFGDLESAYVVASSKVTYEQAKARGFVESDKGKYISRPTVGSSFVLNNEI